MIALPFTCFLCGQRTAGQLEALDHFLCAHCVPYGYFTMAINKKIPHVPHVGRAGVVYCWCGAGFTPDSFVGHTIIEHFEQAGGLQAHYAEFLLQLGPAPPAEAAPET